MAIRAAEASAFTPIAGDLTRACAPILFTGPSKRTLMIREDLSELEAELIQDPDSYDLRERLLSAYAENRDTCLDPRRIEHIRWFIRNHPGDVMCRTPFVHVYPDQQPDVHVVLKEDWLHALAARPADVDVVRAAANFMVLSDRAAAHQLLLDAVNRAPGNGSLRVELGRLSLDPRERLAHFQAGLKLGATDAPNLLVWIAEAAAQAADYVTAESIALELLPRSRECA